MHQMGAAIPCGCPTARNHGSAVWKGIPEVHARGLQGYQGESPYDSFEQRLPVRRAVVVFVSATLEWNKLPLPGDHNHPKHHCVLGCLKFVGIWSLA